MSHVPHLWEVSDASIALRRIRKLSPSRSEAFWDALHNGLQARFYRVLLARFFLVVLHLCGTWQYSPLPSKSPSVAPISKLLTSKRFDPFTCRTACFRQFFGLLNGSLGPPVRAYRGDGLTALVLFILKPYLDGSDSGGRKERILYFRYDAGVRSRNTSSHSATSSHPRLHLPRIAAIFNFSRKTPTFRILRCLPHECSVLVSSHSAREDEVPCYPVQTFLGFGEHSGRTPVNRPPTLS